jgi:tRNA-guanine family transglycosylase
MSKYSSEIFNLKSASVFASYRIADFPRAGLRFHPWQITETKAVLLNAFDLIGNKRTKKCALEWRNQEINLSQGIEFGGALMLDSGAYNFLQHKEISITPEEVLDVALKMKAQTCVVLDHPFPPHATKDEVDLRVQRTLDNTRAMVRRLEQSKDVPSEFRLIPVLHGHDEETLLKCLKGIREAIGNEPEIIGIGSLAPLAQNGSKRKVVDIISNIRKMLPDAHIHCFSMGSALLMLLAFYCGADSVDSQTWVMSAAYKQVQLPGLYLTRFSEREALSNPNYKNMLHRFTTRLVELCHEESFIVKNWDTGDDWTINNEKDALSYLNFLQDQKGVNNLHRRACHNLYSFNFEARKVFEMQSKSLADLERFIQSRLHSTIYKQVFEYAMLGRTISATANH